MGVKISDMSAASTPLAGTELLELVQSGSSVKVAAKDVANSADALPFGSITDRSYGTFCDITDQSGSTTAGTAVKFGTNILASAQITVETDGGGAATEITVTDTGVYEISAILQFKNTDTSDRTGTFWLRKNGSDISNTAGVVVVPKTGDGGLHAASITYLQSLSAGDYVQIMWLPSNTAVTLDYTAAAGGPPATPAVPSSYVCVNRIA